MTPAGWPLVLAKQMRALDTHTIDIVGTPGAVLMEAAGGAIARAALDLLEKAPGAVVVFCGPGNNGGDGWVAARVLVAAGQRVAVIGVGSAEKRTGDARFHYERAREAGVAEVATLSELGTSAGVSVVVDALFGTGLARAIDEGAAATAIKAIAELRTAGARVVAADLPSGLCADTGQVLGCCVEADETVTIGLPKPGLLLEPGRSRSGRVRVARAGIVAVAPDIAIDVHAMTRAAARGLLPARPRTGHKGTFGHALIVAGSEGKTGAAALAARAALRGGAGLVTLACPAGLNDILEPLCLEAMTIPVADTAARGFAASAEDELLALAHERSVVALGPGLGQEPETVSLVRALVGRCERPLVLDADGLNALGDAPELLRGRSAPSVLTPHPGEAARLLSVSPSEINADRLQYARELAERSGATVVLKGAPTVTARPDGAVVVNTSGGPALAVGGTGDVLTGLVAALLAQGVTAESSASLGAFVHGCAGDRIAARNGPTGLLASDLVDELPAALREVSEAARDVDLDSDSLLGFPEP
ncbi:MAG: NAD(P)H-hydrate dehydratase [Myxococcota bacterium]|nr:NAD(P)H-hydrate dehydratase [Myxococcota bacterium]